MRQPPQLVRNLSVRRVILGIVILAAVIGASMAGYLVSRHSTNQKTTFGETGNPNRV